MNAAVRTDALAPFLAAFESARNEAAASAAVRSAAFEHFAALGFPAPRDEAWKYTSLRRLETRSFSPGDKAALSTGVVPAGIRVRTLAAAIADGEPQGALLRVPTGGGTERFAALNAALCADALVVDIAEGAAPDAPLHVRLAASGESGMSHPRLLVRAGRGSTAQVIIHHAGDDEAERFVNSVVDVEASPDSTLHLYRLQDQGLRTFLIERFEATLGQRATLHVHDAELGASLARLDLHARLAAPGATAELTGLFLADGARHLDAHVRADHLSPGTRSLVDYRGIAAGRGRLVFNGKAVVHPDAQRSEARQTSRNLILTPGAEVDTKPELEIYADDVTCSHGATTGQLDPAALFYLRSRGLSEVAARGALTRAFAGAVLSRIDAPEFASAVHAILDDRLARLVEIPE